MLKRQFAPSGNLRMTATFRHVLVTVAALATAPALAKDTPEEATKPPEVYNQLVKCKSVADNAARLSCYDTAVDNLAKATASGEAVVIDKVQVRKARRGLFGFSLPQLDFLAPRSKSAADVKDEQSLTSKVVSARAFGYGMWRIKIDDGAVWETTEADNGFTDPSPGAAVLIEKGAFGSYFIKVGRGQRVKAKRVE